MCRVANALLLLVCLESTLWAVEPIAIGGRLEPLIDDFLLAEKSGDVCLGGGVRICFFNT